CLGQVRVPTQVLHRRGDRSIPFRLGRDVAARIPGATLVPLDGKNHFPWLGDAARIVREVRSFIGPPSIGAAAREAPQQEAAAFMFTDIVASTPLLVAIGDAAWQRLRAWHDRTLRELFAQRAGEEIDNAGDGFFVAFPSTEAALACAVEIQRALAR